MDILFEVTSSDAAKILVPLAKACDRANKTWGCFFTGEGVQNFSNSDLTEVIKSAVVSVACEVSWERYMGEQNCPIEIGSQTNNSTFVGDANKIISL